MVLFNLPNFFTLFNLLSGCVAVVLVFSSRIELVPWCVLISFIADFADGFAARFTKSDTELGKQLDSLADVISFGLVPGCIMFWLLYESAEKSFGYMSEIKFFLAAAPAFLLTAFAALRLAKFNIDTRQSENFIGLATPAATLFVTGLLLIVLHNQYHLADALLHPLPLYIITAALAWLMICEIPMFSFKFRNLSWNENKIRLVFIGLSCLILILCKFAALSVIILLYICLSITLKLFNK
ncbi:MAG: CDP-alcohol phosphatidyltransferase family protein [Chitinophagales bacterium]|nr:CDP-alcohol phosphatidyltransferase family protein [Chitinophagales bacterium]MDW8419160.1 CDP-alcohol phosphatidyltransferase family protein [Chitinophagales bacterium]